MKKLYVGNLVYEVTADQLKELFSQFGEVTSAQIISYRDSGRSKGFGFVELADDAAADQAIQALHGQDHMGRKLVVSVARPPRQGGERGERRGGGGYGRGGGRGGDRGGYRGHSHDGNDSGDMGGGDQQPAYDPSAMGGDDMNG